MVAGLRRHSQRRKPAACFNKSTVRLPNEANALFGRGAGSSFGLGFFVRLGQLFLDLLEVLEGVDFHRRS